MSTPLSGDAALLQQRFSTERFAPYLRAAQHDQDTAVALYRWNVEFAAAISETLGHLEVGVRNALHEGWSARHVRLGRAGTWFDDPAGELDRRAHTDIDRARARLGTAGAALLPGKLVAELPFGFWRFLLARRYTTIWPAVRPYFPHLPSNDRRLLELPVARLHLLRNRIAHHEPLLTVSATAVRADIVTVLDALDPALTRWVEQGDRIAVVHARRPSPH